MKLKAGTIKRIHVDRHIIAHNRKHGTKDPALTVQTSRGSIKTSAVDISGPSRMVYSPDKPLSCGARAWLETKSEIEIA